MKNYFLESVGKLSPHPDIPDECLISDKVSIPFFNSKNLRFVLVLDNENDERFLSDTDKAIKTFLEKDKNERNEISSLVFENYFDYVNMIGEDVGIPKIKTKLSVWRYVYPQEIFIKRRSRRDRDIYLNITCECEWEFEHGLQLVFRQGKKLTRVTSQDGHLTEADVWDKPDEDDELLSNF